MNIDSNDGQAHGSDDEGMETIPPGEEAMFLSHAGGEDELCRSLLEADLAQYVARNHHVDETLMVCPVG